MFNILTAKDFLSGLLMVSVGAVALFLAMGYGLGSLRGPGPGFFPLLVGGCLVLLGGGLMVKVVAHARGTEAIGSWQLLPAFLILGAVVVFALLMRYGHFLLAIVALVVISSMSRGRLTLNEIGEVVIMAVVLCGISAAIFVYGLGMPLKLTVW